jgi:hypothetical protein
MRAWQLERRKRTPHQKMRFDRLQMSGHYDYQFK